MKRIIAFLLVLMLTALLFAGCTQDAGRDGDAESTQEAFSVVGEYSARTIDGKSAYDYLKAAYEADQDYSFEEGLEKEGLDKSLAETPLKLELKEDGTFTMTETLAQYTVEGTWEQKDNTVIITRDNVNSLELTLEGETLVLRETYHSEEKVDIVFSKDK